MNELARVVRGGPSPHARHRNAELAAVFAFERLDGTGRSRSAGEGQVEILDRQRLERVGLGVLAKRLGQVGQETLARNGQIGPRRTSTREQAMGESSPKRRRKLSSHGATMLFHVRRL